ncbi:MAG: MerR family transcriptional regulator [Micromonosporaceae bacterium]
MDEEIAPATLRIGELSHRLGVSDHVLRAWERRYGLLQPVRSPGGYRLYSDADERRIRRMQAHLAAGLSAAEAAQAALSEERAAQAAPGTAGPSDRDGLAGAAHALAQSLDQLDEPGAQAAFDRLLADFTIETVLRDVVLPYLHDLGEGWERGKVSIAREHFASNLLRGRLASIARGWGNGHGPRALLACAPGEQHDLALLAFGIVLHRCGWRVEYLGASTPIGELVRTAAEVHPDLAVVVAVTPERFDGLTAGLARLVQLAPLAVAGAGATPAMAKAVGARLLAADPVTEAERMPPPVSRASWAGQPAQARSLRARQPRRAEPPRPRAKPPGPVE